MPPPPPPAHQNVSMYPGDQLVEKQLPINSSQTCLWDQQTAPPTSTATVDVHLHENYQSGKYKKLKETCYGWMMNSHWLIICDVYSHIVRPGMKFQVLPPIPLRCYLHPLHPCWVLTSWWQTSFTSTTSWINKCLEATHGGQPRYLDSTLCQGQTQIGLANNFLACFSLLVIIHK